MLENKETPLVNFKIQSSSSATQVTKPMLKINSKNSCTEKNRLFSGVHIHSNHQFKLFAEKNETFLAQIFSPESRDLAPGCSKADESHPTIKSPLKNLP